VKKIAVIAGLAGSIPSAPLAAPAAEAALFANGDRAPYGRYLCMDVVGGGVAAGTPVIAYDCHDWSNQQFTMQGISINTIGSNGSRERAASE
jgi:hypothetical protein